MIFCIAHEGEIFYANVFKMFIISNFPAPLRVYFMHHRLAESDAVGGFGFDAMVFDNLYTCIDQIGHRRSRRTSQLLTDKCRRWIGELQNYPTANGERIGIIDFQTEFAFLGTTRNAGQHRRIFSVVTNRNHHGRTVKFGWIGRQIGVCHNQPGTVSAGTFQNNMPHQQINGIRFTIHIIIFGVQDKVAFGKIYHSFSLLLVLSNLVNNGFQRNPIRKIIVGNSSVIAYVINGIIER